MNDAGSPLISYLMSAYQTESFLGQAIDSIVGQTFDRWELVVVDNGNSDSIEAVVRPYLADARIHLVRQPNLGYSGGVASAARVARGRYVCVVDSDDWLMPTHAERVSALLDQWPTTAAVGCDAYLYMNNDRQFHRRSYFESIGIRRLPAAGTRITQTAALGGMMPYYSGVIRRDVWNEFDGYSPPIEDVEEDVLLWLRIAESHEIRLLPEKLACMRIRTDSISRANHLIDGFDIRLANTYRVAALNASDPKTARAADKTVRRVQTNQLLRNARELCLEKKYRDARAAAHTARRLTPSARTIIAESSLTLSPWLVRQMYPLKVWSSRMADRICRPRQSRLQER